MRNQRVTLPIVILLLLAVLVFGFQTLTSPTPTGPGSAGSGPAQLGQRTKTAGCVAKNALPDSACTPGAILADATQAEICQTGYSSKVRNVTEAEKNQVYAEYGIVSHEPGEYEVDHLVSLELGGSNDIANLWPEPAEPRPGFHEKDKVENYLHEEMCNGHISLQQAQRDIATNWLAVYGRIGK